MVALVFKGFVIFNYDFVFLTLALMIGGLLYLYCFNFNPLMSCRVEVKS